MFGIDEEAADRHNLFTRRESLKHLREQLSTHQVVTVVLPSTNGQTLRIRKGSTPEAIHREIYRTLQIPHEVMKPVKTWALTPSP